MPGFIWGCFAATTGYLQKRTVSVKLSVSRQFLHGCCSEPSLAVEHGFLPSQGCSSRHRDGSLPSQGCSSRHRDGAPITRVELPSQGCNSRHKGGESILQNHLWLLPVGAFAPPVVMTGQDLSCLGELSLCYPVNHLVRERFDCRFEEAHKVTVLIYDILLEVP